MPWPLQEAIAHGLAILSWFENYTEEEVPHENLWDDSEGLEQHFKAVRAAKEDGSSYRRRSDDDEDDGQMLGNDLADVFKD